MGEFYTLRDFFQKYKWSYILGILCLVFTDLLQLIIPRVLGNLADTFQRHQLDGTLLKKYVFILVGTSILIALLRFAWRYLVQRATRAMEKYLRNLLYDHLQKLEPSYYDHHRIGDLMAHATNDLNSIRAAFSIGLVMITDAFVLTLATVILMLSTINLRLVLAALLPLPLIALVATRFSRLIHHRQLEVQESFSHLTEHVQESLSGIRVIKSYVQEKPTLEKFNAAGEKYIHANLKLIKVAGLIHPLVYLLSSLSFIIVLGYGGYLIIKQEITLGSFVALNGYLAMLTWPMMALGWVFSVIERGRASMKRINAILETPPGITNHPDAQELKQAQGHISFKNLTFTYPGASQPALKDINLEIEPGQTLGIIGPTGSGKSTLVNLLLRLYDPPHDSIFIDHQDIKKITLESLRAHIGYVPQDAFLFSTSIKENILLGAPQATEEKLEQAVRNSQLINDLAHFPEGLETVIGERGVTLSGGQKQRTALARALLKDPPILILDDAMSAVDTKTEEAILENLKRNRQGKTTIMIAHRIFSIKHADQIIFLEEGRIVERGHHQELMERKGRYYELYEKQLLEEELAN